MLSPGTSSTQACYCEQKPQVLLCVCVSPGLPQVPDRQYGGTEVAVLIRGGSARSPLSTNKPEEVSDRLSVDYMWRCGAAHVLHQYEIFIVFVMHCLGLFASVSAPLAWLLKRRGTGVSTCIRLSPPARSRRTSWSVALLSGREDRACCHRLVLGLVIVLNLDCVGLTLHSAAMQCPSVGARTPMPCQPPGPPSSSARSTPTPSQRYPGPPRDRQLLRRPSPHQPCAGSINRRPPCRRPRRFRELRAPMEA